MMSRSVFRSLVKNQPLVPRFTSYRRSGLLTIEKQLYPGGLDSGEVLNRLPFPKQPIRDGHLSSLTLIGHTAVVLGQFPVKAYKGIFSV